jgi:hypothetical protein
MCIIFYGKPDGQKPQNAEWLKQNSETKSLSRIRVLVNFRSSVILKMDERSSVIRRIFLKSINDE